VLRLAVLIVKKDLDSIRADLSRYDKVREQVFSLSREAIRLSGSSILEIHRGDVKGATETIRHAEEALGKIRKLGDDFSEFSTSPGVVVAFQEFVEASALKSFVESGKIPSLEELGVDWRSYMLGLLDVIGEFRRMSLNGLRKGDVGLAEKTLVVMEGIYEDLQGLDHTSIIPTFRVKMDGARRVIEATRGDVVTEARRLSLEQALDRMEKKIEGGKARKK
jgi:translin